MNDDIAKLIKDGWVVIFHDFPGANIRFACHCERDGGDLDSPSCEGTGATPEEALLDAMVSCGIFDSDMF